MHGNPHCRDYEFSCGSFVANRTNGAQDTGQMTVSEISKCIVLNRRQKIRVLREPQIQIQIFLSDSDLDTDDS